MEMKMFIWANPYAVSYGSSLLTVVAASVDEARELAKTGKVFAYGEYEQRDQRMDGVILGEPTRVLDLPCAEWNEWSE